MKCTKTLLETKGNKKVGNHWSQKTEMIEKYYYHNTCICKINHIEKVVTYDNGGFFTSSTTRAINSYKRSNYINLLMNKGYEVKEVKN